MRKAIRKILREYLQESPEEGEIIDPEQVLDHINTYHMSGWEGKKFEDPEWVLEHDHFIEKEVSLDDPSVKWNFGWHPPVVKQYSKMGSDIPPIVIASNGFIIDGTHRAGAAKEINQDTIKAYVGVKKDEGQDRSSSNVTDTKSFLNVRSLNK